MAVELQSLVYKVPGSHFGPEGTTYSYKEIKSAEEFDAALAAKWLPTLWDAVAAFKQPKKDAEQEMNKGRKYYEAKAAGLSIKFDGRTSDSKLITLVEDAENLKAE